MAKFKPPTPQEVEEYAKKIAFCLNGEHFCDFYAARGWKYNAGLPMVDWKAAVRTWKSRRNKDVTQPRKAPVLAKTAEDLVREIEAGRTNAPEGTLRQDA